ncbi:MAG: hypothetical protein V3R94_12940 [Acidobacteriota bacterium]
MLILTPVEKEELRDGPTSRLHSAPAGWRDERGMALITVLICSVVLVLLGLAVTFSTMTDFSMNAQLEAHDKAVKNADAGFQLAKGIFRGKEITTLLASTTTVNRYLNYTAPGAGTALAYFERNPMAPVEAVNIDFTGSPASIGTRTVNGLLDPVAGVTTRSVGGYTFGQVDAADPSGLYLTKVTDNDDGDGDLLADVDAQVILRIMAIQRGISSETASWGTKTQNSMALIEALIKRDITLNMSAPFTIYGPSVGPAQGANIFGGNSFDLDGYDHDGMTLADVEAGGGNHATFHSAGSSSGFAAIYDDSGSGDADGLINDVCTDLDANQFDNIAGNTSNAGCGNASVTDGTQEIRDDPNNDAENIFDPNYVMNIVLKTSAIADHRFANGSNNTGESLGTDADPHITYCEGDCAFGGNTSGAGLMVVKGRLNLNGNFSFHGLVLVVGDGEMDVGGNNNGILGGVFMAKMVDLGGGNWGYGGPEVTLAGNSNFYFQGSGINLGYTSLPLKVLSWREVLRELEPY